MARSRGLITSTELERLKNPDDVDDQKRYQSISRIRKRINDELPREIGVLEEHHPELLEELRDVVCETQE
jgi:hypothetical protein